jgi:hypothetical protein
MSLVTDAESDVDPLPQWSALREWGCRAALALFVAYLLVRAWQARTAPYVPVDWAFQNADEVIAWLRGLARRELVVFGLSFVLGLLTPPALRRADGQQSVLAWLGWCVFGLATIGVCLAIAWNEFPRPGTLLLPFVSFLAGAKISFAALRGWWPLVWAVGVLGLIAVALVIGAVVAARMTLAAEPLKIEADPMSMADKRQLAQRIRDTRAAANQPRRLLLNDAEVSALANSALGRGGAAHRGRAHFKPALFTADGSMAMPSRVAEGKFLNVRMAGRIEVDDGHLELELKRLQVGSLNVPQLLLRLLSGTLHAMLMDDTQVRQIIEAIDSVRMEPGAIEVVFQPGALSRQIVPSLAQLLWSRPDVSLETGVYVRHLIAAYKQLPADDSRFGRLLQSAFALAAKRSTTNDPILENRAALFALAILLGHPGLEPFVGEVFDSSLQAQAAPLLNTVTLRGRHDWTRHFYVSAALALLSNESTSDRVGLLKEQEDSQGGSGFSFADMLANSAGTRLALAATRDATAARRVQARLARGVNIDELFPPAADLPEDLTAAELQSRFGGVEGEGYKAMLVEINRRLAALPAL